MTTKPTYRYELHVEVPPTEAAVLSDALEGEDLSLRDRLGEPVFRAQLAAEEIAIDEVVEAPWVEFAHDIEVLSTYLSVLIRGREIIVSHEGGATLVSGALFLGRRGELVRLPLSLSWDASHEKVVDHGVDEAAARKLDDLPDWVAGSPGVFPRIAAA
jgi:hypothetical protein